MTSRQTEDTTPDSSGCCSDLPPQGNNPSTDRQGTSPGSFANRPRISAGVEGAMTYSSPDTPNMPAASNKTAWDFMPAGWRCVTGKWIAPKGFDPVTQLD